MNTRQTGSVLVISLLVLLVATLMSITGITTSQLQERIAANQKQTVIAQMAAESGASLFVGWLEEEMNAGNMDDVWGTDAWQDIFPASLNPESDAIYEKGRIGDQGFFWVENTEIITEVDDEGNENEYWEIVISGHVRNSGGGVLSTQRISYKIGLPPGVEDKPVHKAFGGGLLAENNIRINGNVDLRASAHANGSIRITGGNNYVYPEGILSAVDYVDVSGVDPSQIIYGPGFVDRVEIPRVDDLILNPLSELAYDLDDPNNDPDYEHHYDAYQDCDLELSGDYDGAVIFCVGDMTIHSPKSGNNYVSFSNVTLATRGSITYNGSANLSADGKINVAMIANDSITFNGSSTSYGVFWLNGDYIHNGRGTVVGAIVSAGRWNQIEADADDGEVVIEVVDEDSGTIIRNGVFSFTGNGNIANPHLPRDEEGGVAPKPLVREWKQLY